MHSRELAPYFFSENFYTLQAFYFLWYTIYVKGTYITHHISNSENFAFRDFFLAGRRLGSNKGHKLMKMQIGQYHKVYLIAPLWFVILLTVTTSVSVFVIFYLL